MRGAVIVRRRGAGRGVEGHLLQLAQLTSQQAFNLKLCSQNAKQAQYENVLSRQVISKCEVVIKVL